MSARGKLPLGLTLLALAACSTPYTGGMGLMGGVEAQPITGDIYRIQARGNAYTDAARVQDFVLLKAAETTLAVGKTHFLLGASSDATRVGTFRTPDTFNTTSFG